MGAALRKEAQGEAGRRAPPAPGAAAEGPPPEEVHWPHHPAPHPLAARPVEPEPHGPGLVERELGTGLRPDPTAALGHPGVRCEELPHGHAHALHELKHAMAAAAAAGGAEEAGLGAAGERADAAAKGGEERKERTTAAAAEAAAAAAP